MHIWTDLQVYVYPAGSNVVKGGSNGGVSVYDHEHT